MAIGIVAATDAGTVTTQTQTFAFDATGCTVLIVVSVNEKSRTYAGVTFNEVAMTQLWSELDGGTGLFRCAGYILVNPTQGSYNVVVSLNTGAPDYLASVAVGFSGVDTSTPTRTVYVAQGATDSPTITDTDSQNGDVVIDGAIGDGQPAVEAVGQTKQGGGTGRVGNSGYGYGCSTKPSIGALTIMSWTGISGRWAQGSVALIPTAAAGISPAVLYRHYERMKG